MSEETDAARAATYDETFRALHAARLMPRLWAVAAGDQYPHEVEPFSSCSWWLLGRLVAGLRLRPGATLVDLGCGRGGPGLWLARALSAQLIGIDFSPAAVEIATSRADAFVRPQTAIFSVGAFDATGLPDGSADGAVSVDALPFAPDRDAALREVRRILRPGGRLAFTGNRRAGAEEPDMRWEERLAAAGFRLEECTPNPHHHGHWRAVYRQWRDHAAQLRHELGDAVTDRLLAEAADERFLDEQDAIVLVATAA